MKDSKYYFSRLDLTPLLDVVFIFLFVVLVIFSRHYNDTVTKEKEKFQQTIQQLTTQLEQLQQSNTALLHEKDELIQKQEEFNQLLQAQAEKWKQVQQALVEKEENIALLKTQLAKTKEQSITQLDKMQAMLDNTKNGQAQITQQLNEQLVSVQQALTVETTKNAQLLTQQQQLAKELAQTKQQNNDYYTHIQRLTEIQQTPSITTLLKAEFVNEIINTYLITIEPLDPEHTGEGNKVILTTRSGQKRDTIIYQQNKSQLKDFFDENIPQQNKDKTFIIFLRDNKSSLEYAKWVKEYLKDNQFYFKESLMDTALTKN